MNAPKNLLRKVTPWGIGVVLGAVAWLAINFVGIASQLASVGKYLPDVPVPSVENADIAVPEARLGTSSEVAPAAALLELDSPAPPYIGDAEDQRDYVADFDVLSATTRAPIPDTGRLVMDPKSFVFDVNDTDLDSAIDEWMFHPDEAIRQAAIENLMPAMGR